MGFNLFPQPSRHCRRFGEDRLNCTLVFDCKARLLICLEVKVQSVFPRFIRNLTVRRFYIEDSVDSIDNKTPEDTQAHTDSGSSTHKDQEAMSILMELWDDGNTGKHGGGG